MSEEDDFDDEVTRCPFCEKPECAHIVAAFDHENAEIGGGLFSDRQSELLAIVKEGFESVLASHGESVAWGGHSDFEDLWNDFLDSRAAGYEEPFDAGIFAHLLDKLLRDTDAVSEGESAVVAFYDRRPQAVYEQVVATIRKACAAARAKHE